MVELWDVSGTLHLGSSEVLEHIKTKTDLVAKYKKETKSDATLEKVLDTDEFFEWAYDEIVNEAEVVESFDRVVENYDTFSHNVLEYQGIFFYQSMDYDDVGYWLDRQAACDYAECQANP